MTEEEIKKRTVTFEEITKKAKCKINNGFRGKAVVAFVDLLGFSEKIISDWDDPDKDPLLTLMELKSFLELATEKTESILFHDHDKRTVIQEISHPKIITVSDSFMFLLPLDETSEQTILGSILAVVTNCLELWRISIDKGFTIRGGIEYGDIYYNNLDIVGNAFMTAYHLESKVASNSRIILSNNIKSLIDQNLDNIHPSFQEYFLRYLYKDKDDFLAVNPTMILAHEPEIAERTLFKLEAIMKGISNPRIKSKYDDLLNFVKNQDMELRKREIFK